ncbi:MAG: hypothetical protein ACREFT_07375 [Acetobacteraceae bacterium]
MNAISASLGIYSVPDAARITDVPSRRIRGWLQGYAQRRGRAPAEPILHHQHAIRDGELALGFLDLLEVAFLGRISQAAECRGRTLSWKALRHRRGDSAPGAAHRTSLRREAHPHGRAQRLSGSPEGNGRCRPL